MKILKKIVLFVFIGALFVTCKKETLTPSTTVIGQPVFSFNGTIGAASMPLQAGVNNYYMYSSYTQNPAGINVVVYSFTGTLQNTATPNNSISITINDDTTVSPGASSNISKSVTPTSYYYNIPEGNPIWDSVTFSPSIYAGNPTKFTYNFGDASTQISTYNASPVQHLYKILKNYTTSLSVVSSTGSPTITNPLNLKKQTTTPLTIESMSATDSSPPDNHTVSFSAYVSGGAPPYTYVWFFGNGSRSGSISTSTSVTTSYTYTTEPAQTYTDTFLVVDRLLDTAMHTYTLIDTTVSSTCRMDYFTTIRPIENPNAFSNVTVNYTDANGNQYTSNNYAQPITSTFQITSVSNYQNNLKGNPTKMLSVTFTCMLYPVNSNAGLTPIQASNCTATIAVAYH